MTGDSSKHALGNILNCFPVEVLGAHSSPSPPGNVTVPRPRTTESRRFLGAENALSGLQRPQLKC